MSEIKRRSLSRVAQLFGHVPQREESLSKVGRSHIYC